tara:strand:+ start:202 stop:543 length:342 start_codon:yes stop_codon:yes gene_type:complete
MSYRVSNTQTGTTNRKGEWTPNRTDDGDIIYSSSLKITVEHPSSDFTFPNSLESSRINDFAQAKVEAGETLKTSNSAYRLISDSVKEFEATDKMSAAITAIYRPVGLRFTTPL